MHNKRRRPLAALLAALVAIGVLLAGGATPAYAKPAVGKNLTPNGDGTYTLSLSVTGDASSSHSSTNANVVIVFDSSGSMKEKTYTYQETNDTQNTYGLVGDKYVKLFRSGRRYYYTDDDGYPARYTGTRYRQVQTNKTRLQVAQEATNGLIGSLLQNNTENPDAVEISLVEFDSIVNSTSDWSKDQGYLTGIVNNYSADHQGNYRGGTNWEVALAKAKQLADAKFAADGDATYIVFVSDGNPTFRTTNSPSPNATVDPDSNTVYGTGNDDYYGYNLRAAQYVARSIKAAGYNMYTVGAFGDVSNMKSLVAYDNGTRFGEYYDASDEAGLNQAFADIIKNITSGLSYTDVKVTDNLTSLTSALPEGSKATDFSYTYTKYNPDTKTDEPYTPTPAPNGATLNGSKVEWSFGDNYTLEQGVTYTVSFKVWPSQDAYDLLADLNNGAKSYEKLTEDEQDMVFVKSSGKYSLRTNTKDGNELTYTEVQTTTTNGSTTTTKTPGTLPITERPAVDLTSQQVSVKKEWPNILDKRTGSGNVEVTVSSDAASPAAVDVKLQPTNYNGSAYIAPGIMTGSVENGWIIYDTGHDYTMTEKSADDVDHWEFSSDTYHPMLVNGELKMLVKAGDGDVPIGNDTYRILDGAATLTGKNNRRSNVNLTKVVTAADGATAPENAEFTFKLTADAKGADVWYTIYEGDKQVGDAQSFKSGNEGVEVKLKAGQNLRLLNLPTGSTYSFEETNMPKGFSFVGATGAAEGSKKVEGSVSGPNTSTTFTYTNSYKPESTTVDTDAGVSTFLKKSVDATTEALGKEGKTFEFSIAAATDGAPMPKDAEGNEISTGSAKFTENDTKAIDFGTITYDKAGTYKYTVTETTELGTGWTVTPESKSATVIVNVEDKDGKLQATVTGATITNKYSTSSVKLEGDTALKAQKTLTGRDWLGTDSFQFTLSALTEGAPMPEDSTVTATSADPVSFGSIEYAQPGTYNYSISEVKGQIPGVTYTESTAPVTVFVKDNGQGALVATVDYGEGKTAAQLTNTYTPGFVTLTGETAIRFDKVLQYAELKGGEFSFELTGDGIDGKLTATNNADGSIVFPNIIYTAAGTYSYTVKEVAAEGTPYDYDATEKTVTVTVTDDPAAGKLVASVSYPAGTTFTNTYTAKPGEVSISAVKNVNDQAATENIFQFTISALDGGNLPAETTVTNNGGSVVFGPISYDASIFDDAEGTKTFPTDENGNRYVEYKYQISEEQGSAKGYAYDTQAKTVTVRVTDDGNGNLTAAVQGDAPVFSNTYTPEPVSVDPPVSKVVEGYEGVAYPTFSFTIAATSEGAPMPPQATASIAGPGKVEFGNIEYTKAGHYTYTINENAVDAKGWTIDSTVYTMTVDVKDAGGYLTADTKVTKADDAAVQSATFTNTYKALPTSAYLNAKKVLDGRDLVAGEFSFELLDADGKVIDTRTNDAAGNVKFDNLSYDAAGTYTYTMREVKGDDSAITYDDKEVAYKVVVEDKDGQLTVTSVKADDKDEAAVFTNTYTKPKTPVTPASPNKPAPATPASPAAPAKSSGATKSSGAVAKTGDTTTSVVGIVIAGAAIVAGGLYLRKRNTAAKK